MIGRGEVAVVTHRSITIHEPACFYSDDNGPIRHIQVIVAESAGKTPPCQRPCAGAVSTLIHNHLLSYVCLK